jgi:metal-dependent amidase/aminoacylase/carboxypeptidase family protein
MMGLMGIHAQRETFRDEDCIRVHPIITKGGDLVNVVPADVRIETFVRGKTVQAIQDAHIKVNRALRAGAMAIGAEVEINNLPGYLPSLFDESLEQLFADNMKALLGPDCVAEAGHQTGSSDIGDISHLMPALHAFVQAGKARVHTEEFEICDPRDRSSMGRSPGGTEDQSRLQAEVQQRTISEALGEPLPRGIAFPKHVQCQSSRFKTKSLTLDSAITAFIFDLASEFSHLSFSLPLIEVGRPNWKV